jgi:glycolate dehydrogenase FAD-binding subunit
MSSGQSGDRLAQVAQSIVDPDGVRLATLDDRFGTVAPLLVVAPGDAESAAGTLAWASRDKVPLAIVGRGTKLTWGAPMRPVDLVVSTARLNAVVDHRFGDLTATVQAGAPLAYVNRELGMHNQWIPLDPHRDDAATIGGIVATNDSGPRRHRHGAPRDLIIGMTMARADGRLARSGGIVVKNVAGYDMARLMTGSLGTLALIVDATFKLAPVAPASRTVAVTAPGASSLGSILAAIASGQTMPAAVDLEMPPPRLLVRFESVERAAHQQAMGIAHLASKHGARSEVLSGEDESALWRAHATRPWSQSGCVLKVGLLPAQLGTFVEAFREMAGPRDWEVIGRAGLGVVLLRVDAQDEDLEAIIKQLRARFKPGEGHVSLLRASDDLKRRLGAVGAVGDSLRLMQAIKREFDPAGILNPGRGAGDS